METYGRYRILNRIGLGGMGEVFRAKSIGIEGFERPVAVKVILPELCDEPDFQNMFLDEARIAMHIQHANVVQVLDLGEVGGRYFLAMELVDGTDISRILKNGRKKDRPLVPGLALQITMEALKGLDHAHRALGPDGKPLNVVHRDVTPQNILVSIAGEVKLTDFGIARASNRAQYTNAGVVRGKLAFMAPEQMEAGAIGPWTDVWGAALVLLTLLRGKHPLDGISETEVVERLRKGDLPTATSMGPGVPRELDAVMSRALAPKSRDRFRSASEFLEALEEVVHASGIRTGSRLLADYMQELFREELTAQGRHRSQIQGPDDVATSKTPSSALAAKSSSAISLNEFWVEGMPGGAPAERIGQNEPRATQPTPRPASSSTTRYAVSALVVLVAIAIGGFSGRRIRDDERDRRSGAIRPDRPSDAPVGWLDLDPFPWAEVSVDGKAHGATPIRGLTLDPGKHLVEYRTADGRQGRVSVEIRAGRTAAPALP